MTPDTDDLLTRLGGLMADTVDAVATELREDGDG